MRNLKITTRVTLGSCTVLALLLCLALIAVHRMSIVDRNLATINDVNSVKQRFAINFRGSVHDRAIALRDVILVQDVSELPGVLKTITDLNTKYQQSAGPLDTMLLPAAGPTADELGILNSIKSTERRTMPLIEQVIARRQSGDVQGATDLLMQKARPQFVQWLKEINQFIDLQEARNKEIAGRTRVETGSFKLIIGLLCLGALTIGGFIIWWSTTGVRQLPGMTRILEDLARGERDVVVPLSDTHDELGQLARALTSFRDQLAAAESAKNEQAQMLVASIGSALDALAQGDLVSRVDVELTGPFAKLKADFNSAAESLQTTLGQVASAANGINCGAAEIRKASDDLSQRTLQQAAGLEETAAAMDELTSTVRATAGQAADANTAVRTVRDVAERSGVIVREAVQAMSDIERTSVEISDIIAVIDGIAFQTNLLALNAGVEAARAGDAGKGFAVVAAEVRALAQRSAEAAKDVKARITASGAQVVEGVRLVGQTGKALDQIIDRIGDVSGLVSKIATAAEHQASGLQQVNTTVAEMDGMTQQNAAMVEEATAAARDLADGADGLIRQVARFRTGEADELMGSPVHQLRNRLTAVTRDTPRPNSGRTARTALG